MRKSFWIRASAFILAAILPLAAGCGQITGPPPTSTPLPIIPATAAPTITPSPTPIGPAAIDFNAPIGLEPSPLDLAVIEAANLDQLAPFKELSAGGLPASISGASLAFFPSYKFELVGHLNDGQLLVWDMSTGALAYRDQKASADSYSGQHPASLYFPAATRRSSRQGRIG
ncbi:MAG: hypothetical protein ACC742_15515 [Thermoanaerobaculales bacterium]